MDRYEFSWTENGQMNAFGLHGTSEAVAKAIRAGLRKAETAGTITGLNVHKVSETREAVTGPDPV